MATTSVKLTQEGKEELDRLQARLLLLGHRLTKEHILELALRAASMRPGDLIAAHLGGHLSLTTEETKRFLRQIERSTESWGRTSWKDIDELVYGWRKYK